MKIEAAGGGLLGPPVHVIERPQGGGIDVAHPALTLVDKAVGFLDAPGLARCNRKAGEVIVILGVVVRSPSESAGIQYVVDIAGDGPGSATRIIVSANQLYGGVSFVLGRERLGPRLAATVGHGRSTELRVGSHVQDGTAVGLEIRVVSAETADVDVGLVSHLKAFRQRAVVLHDVARFYSRRVR